MNSGLIYKISFRARHATMPVAELEAALPAPTGRSWTAGDPRTTPSGRPLDGVFRDSCCHCDLGEHSDGELARFLDATLAAISIRQGVLLDLKAKGAAFSFTIILWADGDIGETFDADLLARMAELGISLELTVVSSSSGEGMDA